MRRVEDGKVIFVGVDTVIVVIVDVLSAVSL